MRATLVALALLVGIVADAAYAETFQRTAASIVTAYGGVPDLSGAAVGHATENDKNLRTIKESVSNDARRVLLSGIKGTGVSRVSRENDLVGGATYRFRQTFTSPIFDCRICFMIVPIRDARRECLVLKIKICSGFSAAIHVADFNRDALSYLQHGRLIRIGTRNADANGANPSAISSYSGITGRSKAAISEPRIEPYAHNGEYGYRALYALPVAILLILGAAMVAYGLYCCPTLLGLLVVICAGIPINAALWIFLHKISGLF